jgi:hypothetical protein
MLLWAIRESMAPHGTLGLQKMCATTRATPWVTRRIN